MIIYAIAISYVLVMVVVVLTIRKMIQRKKFLNEYSKRMNNDLVKIKNNMKKVREHIERRTVSHTEKGVSG